MSNSETNYQQLLTLKDRDQDQTSNSQIQNSQTSRIAQDQAYKFTRFSSQTKQYNQQIGLLQQRINILSKENLKQQKKYQNKQKEFQKHQEIISFKEQQSNIIQQGSYEKQLMKEHIKKQIERERLMQLQRRQEVAQREDNLRRQRTDNTKMLSQMNEQEIRKFEQETFEQKKRMYEQMKQQKERMEEGVDQFWMGRFQGYSQTRQELQNSYQQEKLKKDKIVGKMMELENLQIQNLQKSQRSLMQLENSIRKKSTSIRTSTIDVGANITPMKSLY